MINLKIAEVFFSCQGEGVSTGVPAVFIRLAGCNLMCGGSEGSLIKEGKASWWCDSERIWREGKETTYEELETLILKQATLDDIVEGTTHLVWTGGEPTIPIARNGIMGFLDYFYKKYPQAEHTMFNEIETNGTKVVGEEFYNKYIQQINCSPKLANSGVDKEIRINKEALIQINNCSNSWFKFVISEEKDIDEIEEDFIKTFELLKTKIILMPSTVERQDCCAKTRFVLEMAKKYNYRCCTRLQIIAWDRAVGV